MDIHKPQGIDGFETCRRLKQQERLKDVPIIFMTILAETVDKLKGFEVWIISPNHFSLKLSRKRFMNSIRLFPN
jgi:CheY-like chemotaxis protein